MTKKLRVALAEINPIVGDIEYNLKKHLAAAERARDELKADIIVFPELSLTGYPPEDLLLRPSFIQSAHEALNEFIAKTKNIYCVINHPHLTSSGLLNSSSLIFNGTILGRYHKQHLPNYGVFDENRYFIAGTTPCVVPIHGIPVGLVICEDLWFPGPVQQAASLGARLILSPNASPFEMNKHEQRVDMLSKRAKINRMPIVYVNQVGAQDGIVFDGGSMVIDEQGVVAECAGFFNEHLHLTEIEITTAETKVASIPFEVPHKNKRMYDALVLGLRDYIHKNHFSSVVLGLSGGVDSALTLAIAVDALGAKNVHAVILPSRYTADISIKDALLIAKNLNVTHEIISIEPAYEAFLNSLAPSFKNKEKNLTEENIQARIRAVILMALSNKFGQLVLTTGNRSELAVGYCTIYGDMAGGYAVLKDVLKTEVYELCHYRNEIQSVIPTRIIERPPTAELAENQKDEDTLPPYAILDEILKLYLNESLSPDDIIAKGFDADVVAKIVKLIHRNEYKRSQAAIGTRINLKSFGKDWRYPLTNGFAPTKDIDFEQEMKEWDVTLNDGLDDDDNPFKK